MITPEMIKAGAAVVRDYDSRVEDEFNLAENVFIEMFKIAEKRGSQMSRDLLSQM